MGILLAGDLAGDVTTEPKPHSGFLLFTFSLGIRLTLDLAVPLVFLLGV